jgi:hypothetical protein
MPFTARRMIAVGVCAASVAGAASATSADDIAASERRVVTAIRGGRTDRERIVIGEE